MRERIANLSRRELLKLFGISVGTSLAGEAAWPRKIQAQSRKVTPRKNVRNVIFIQNCGAMSPPECLDFKETRYTAKDLEAKRQALDKSERVLSDRQRGTLPAPDHDLIQWLESR